MALSDIDAKLSKVAQITQAPNESWRDGQVDDTDENGECACADPEKSSRCSRCSQNRCKCHFSKTRTPKSREHRVGDNSKEIHELHFSSGASGNLKTRCSRAQTLTDTESYIERGSIGSILVNPYTRAPAPAHARARAATRFSAPDAPDAPETLITHCKIKPASAGTSREHREHGKIGNLSDISELSEAVCVSCLNYAEGYGCSNGLAYGRRQDDASPERLHYCRFFRQKSQ